MSSAAGHRSSASSPDAIDEVHGAAERRLSKVGQRHTRQRREILERVASAGRPVTVPDLLAGDDSVSQSSLYRNLVVLVDVGVLQRVAGWGNHDRFELSESLSGHHHHHLTCTVCGKVDDITADRHLRTGDGRRVGGGRRPLRRRGHRPQRRPLRPLPRLHHPHRGLISTSKIERFCTISRPRIASTAVLQRFWVAKSSVSARFCLWKSSPLGEVGERGSEVADGVARDQRAMASNQAVRSVTIASNDGAANSTGWYTSMSYSVRRHLVGIPGADLGPAKLLDLPVARQQPGAVRLQLAVLVDDAELDREPERPREPLQFGLVVERAGAAPGRAGDGVQVGEPRARRARWRGRRVRG